MDLNVRSKLLTLPAADQLLIRTQGAFAIDGRLSRHALGPSKPDTFSLTGEIRI